MKYLIIGNGIAGVRGAEAIRGIDKDCGITMICGEKSLPYCRPMISMVLEGSKKLEDLPIRNQGFYDDLKINPVTGRRISGIDIDKKHVILPAQNGSGHDFFEFDRLLIATGADPRPIKADGKDLENIFYMRTDKDVENMVKALSNVKNALVLGGGLVGFKAAYGLIRRNIKVTMLIKSAYPLSMQIDEKAGHIVLDKLIKNGLDVRVGIEAEKFEGRGKVEKAYLSDGSVADCQMVIIGKGVMPCLDFVPKDKIKTDLGILVDNYMETSSAGIFAAGDVIQTNDIARQNSWVNAIWPEASEQGRIAGLNMAGRKIKYPGSLGRNVIRIFDLDIMTAGIVNPDKKDGCEILAFEDNRRNTYRKLVFKNNILKGMVLVNNIEQGGILLSLIRSQTEIKIQKDILISPSFNYKKLMSFA